MKKPKPIETKWFYCMNDETVWIPNMCYEHAVGFRQTKKSKPVYFFSANLKKIIPGKLYRCKFVFEEVK